MQHLIGQYYGTDWVAMVMSLLFMYFIGSKKRFGFIFGLISAVAWIAVNVMANIWPGIILNTVLIVMHARGYLKWGKTK